MLAKRLFFTEYIFKFFKHLSTSLLDGQYLVYIFVQPDLYNMYALFTILFSIYHSIVFLYGVRRVKRLT